MLVTTLQILRAGTPLNFAARTSSSRTLGTNQANPGAVRACYARLTSFALEEKCGNFSRRLSFYWPRPLWRLLKKTKMKSQ